MGLYLAVFDNEDNELDGLEVGTYGDFADFRESVARLLENGKGGSMYPVLMHHSDCDGCWTSDDATRLERELSDISYRLRLMPPVPIVSNWKKEIARTRGLNITNLYDCYFDVDGIPLIERLIDLCKLSQRNGVPILFQ